MSKQWSHSPSPAASTVFKTRASRLLDL
jgi:hypothetical protein